MEGLLHTLEQSPGHQGFPGLGNPHWLRGLLSLRRPAPDGSSGVGFVGEQVVESTFVPAFATVGDAPIVQLFAYLLEAVASEGALEYLLHYRSSGRVNLQSGTLLRPVADFDPLVAEGSLGAEEEASRCRLPHPPNDLLREIL